MLHRIEKLVLISEVAENEVDKTEGEEVNACLEDRVNYADDKNQNRLGEEEAVIEHWGFDELIEVCS